MSNVSTEKMGKGWDDPTFQDAVLAKGQRRARKSTATTAMKEPMLCTNCQKPVYARAINTCQCSIWERGRLR